VTSPRNVKSPTSPPRASAITKTKSTPAAAKPKDLKAKTATKPTARAGVAAGAPAATSVAAEQQAPHEEEAEVLHPGAEHDEEASGDAHTDTHEEPVLSDEGEPGAIAHAEVTSEEHHEELSAEEPSHEEAAVEEHTDEGTHDEMEHVDEEHLSLNEEHETGAPAVEEHSVEATEETVNGHGVDEKATIPGVEIQHVEDASPAAHDEIEAMVNLLEGTKLTDDRPRSIASIPDEEN